MPEGLRFFVGFGHEVEFHLDFELAPAGFGDGEGGAFDHAGGVRVGLVEFELDFFEPVGYVFVVDAFDIDGPFVRVILVRAIFAVGGVDGFGDGAVDWSNKIISTRFSE